jgi:ribosomal protein S18 acetylase RimI-like enzyme
MDLSQIKRNIRQFGPSKTFEDVAFRALNRGIFVRILKGVKIDAVNPEFLKCDEKYRGLFLNEAMLTEFAEGPEYELSKRFLHQALAKGDECYGILNGDVLAAYGWYSNKPTEIDPPALVLHFNDQYIYMYKGYTHVNYRGQRLHAIAMTRALEAYLARGYKGIVSYVDCNNFASLKSCYRMGYTDVGSIYAARLFNHYFLHSDAGCERYGFGLEWVRSNGNERSS